MAQHPELEPGEVFVTNTTKVGFEQIGWKTKRAGNQPFHPDGFLYHSGNWPGQWPIFPVFAQVSEIQEKAPGTYERYFNGR